MGAMEDGVHAALAGRPNTDPRDVGAETLAIHYATLIDRAAPAERYRKALAVISRALVGKGWDSDDPDEAFATISAALAEHSVSSDLGPKLLQALTGLGLTTAARGDGKDKSGNAKPADPLDELKARRAARLAQ